MGVEDGALELQTRPPARACPQEPRVLGPQGPAPLPPELTPSDCCAAWWPLSGRCFEAHREEIQLLLLPSWHHSGAGTCPAHLHTLTCAPSLTREHTSTYVYTHPAH